MVRHADSTSVGRDSHSQRRRRYRRAACSLVERLEPRTLLTIVFNTVFGAEGSVNTPPFDVMNSATIHVVLWGTHWGTGAGQFNPTTVENEASAILNSTFLQGLQEYGDNGVIGSVDFYVDTSADPPSDFNPGNLGDGHSLGEAETELGNLVTAGDIPGPGSPADLLHAPYYAILTDPTDSPTNGGYNDSGPVNGTNVNICSLGTDKNFTFLGDTFSHEIAEHLVDASGNGVVLSLPSGEPTAVGSGNVQACDGECEPGGQPHYTYRIGGPSSLAIVQPIWSTNLQAFAVDDGNSEQFSLAPIWNTSNGTANASFTNSYNLTINGDQLAGKNDSIILSQDSDGGTEVNLNGQIAYFDPFNTNATIGTPLNSITINGLSGNDTITIDYSGGNPIPSGGLTINGGSGTNTLVATGQSNTWAITGVNSGTLNGNAFSNIQDLTGGGSSDTFHFSPGGSVSGNVDGGSGGTNAVDYSALSGPVTVNLNASTAPGIGGTFSNINSVTGSGGSDVLIGSGTWSITGTNSGSVGGVSFASFENLTGDGSSDTFAFKPGGSVSGNIDGGGGTNTLDYSALTGPITLDVGSNSAPHIGGTFINVTNFVGSAGSDTLAGPNSATTWNITGSDAESVGGDTFSSFENLAGGSAADTFAFQPGGSLSGNIDGGGGANTLDDSALAGPVTVNLQTDTATHLGGTFANIGNFVGSASANDTLIGPDASWIINGTNAGSVNGITFSSFENLTGNVAADTFSFFPGGSITGNLDGGGGNNTLDYSALSGPITVNLGAGTAPGIGGTFTNINILVGSASLNDTLVGPSGTTTWNLTGSNSGNVNGTTTFSSFENLTGGAGDDTFTFFPGGGLTGNIDGGGGNNTLDYHNLSTPVFINLSNNTATAIGGHWANINAFVGGTGINTVIGLSASSTYVISGPNTFSVSGFKFIGFNSITGGPGNDTFAFLTGGSLSGNIDGGGGINLITYAGYMGDVVANLRLHTATAVGGTIMNIQNLTGGIGNTMFVGDANANVLSGGTGRSILIGGAGADTLIGGGSDNILIGDSTIYDTNAVALAAIFAEWTRTDASFEQRVAHLISPGDNGLNGSYTFDKKAIISDNAADILQGSTSILDWFFADKKLDTDLGTSPQDHTTQV